MRRPIITSLWIILSQIFWVGCTTPKVQDALDSPSVNHVVHFEPTPTPIDKSLASLSSSSLCDRIGEIEVIHDRVPEESDDLYKAIIVKGDEALPCLVEKINDRTKTHDPRTAPKWQHYVVGDTAVFTVLMIASRDDYKTWEALMLDSLPPKYRDEWKTNGVYAYFNYVSEPKNRKILQSWWKKWLKENKK